MENHSHVWQILATHPWASTRNQHQSQYQHSGIKDRGEEGKCWGPSGTGSFKIAFTWLLETLMKVNIWMLRNNVWKYMKGPRTDAVWNEAWKNSGLSRFKPWPCNCSFFSKDDHPCNSVVLTTSVFSFSIKPPKTHYWRCLNLTLCISFHYFLGTCKLHQAF